MKTLFDIENLEWWREHWQDMPEFDQQDLTSHRSIIVHFRNDEDVQKFSELIGQKITYKQPSCWYPELNKRYRNKIYIDGNES